ncbi:hypothetical protein GGU10DRAFT_355755, partial [Lentinula aff. detonsa]
MSADLMIYDVYYFSVLSTFDITVHELCLSFWLHFTIITFISNWYISDIPILIFLPFFLAFTQHTIMELFLDSCSYTGNTCEDFLAYIFVSLAIALTRSSPHFSL